MDGPFHRTSHNPMGHPMTHGTSHDPMGCPNRLSLCPAWGGSRGDCFRYSAKDHQAEKIRRWKICILKYRGPGEHFKHALNVHSIWTHYELSQRGLNSNISTIGTANHINSSTLTISVDSMQPYTSYARIVCRHKPTCPSHDLPRSIPWDKQHSWGTPWYITCGQLLSLYIISNQ